MLMTVRDRIIIREQDPGDSGEKERRTIYNPYKKQYVVRQPTIRKTKAEELQLLLRENEDECDIVWIGDEMNENKEDGTIRIWMQNTNGIEKHGSDKIMYNLSQLVDNNIDYFSLIETKMNQYHKVACKKWDMAKDRIMPNGSIMITSTPEFPTHSPYQPGGLLSGYKGQFRSRYNTSGRDKLGRWHFHQFYGKERDLRIYSLYRVNNGNDSSQGDTTAWTQQKLIMKENNDLRNPRTAVIDDFLCEIQNAIDDKLSVIILADANESLDGPEKTNEKFGDIGLVNLMEEYIGKNNLPRTCNRGPNTIDHIWVTSNVLSEVTRAGFAPFDFMTDSDHRGLYFDFKLKNLLDANIFHLEPPKLKRLKSSIPMRVEKYLTTIEEQMKYHKLLERFTTIYEDFSKNGRTSENEEKLNKLDTQLTEIMLHAEDKCSNLPTYGLLAWSKKLKAAIRKLIKAGSRRKKARKLKIGMDVKLAKEEFKLADEAWKEAKTEYTEVKKKAKELRKEHIEECAKHNVENDEKLQLKSEIKRLKTIEEQREQARRMKYVLNPFSRGGVTTVLIPAIVAYPKNVREEEGFDHYNIEYMWKRILPHNGKDIRDWERITDKVVVQRLLLQWQRKHFTQSSETPLGTVEWTDELRKKDVQEKILKGEYYGNNVPEEVNELLSQMKRPKEITEELSMASSIDEFWAFIKGSSEKTSTSPSGRGYNHYKSLMQGDFGKKVIELIHNILELARKHGIILQRWKKTVTTLMEKDVGRPRIHRMRALHIIEAEVQFIAKLNYCKKLMNNAEKYDLITSQQHGGRRNKQAQSAIINKLMYYNITHQRLMEAAFMDDDARNCYDRIITALSSVEMRSWGQAYEEAEFSVEFLHQQEYHIRTQLGISKEHYKYSREEPTFGSGQGIGWAGVKFTRSSDTICRVMKKTCKGMRFNDPDNMIIVEKNADLFVDDTALGVTKNKCDENHTALHQLIQDQQKHAYLLFSSGHKLALDKCVYYWVDFIRDGDKYRHKFIEEHQGEMFLKEGYDYNDVKVKRLQPFTSHKTLGSYISVNGNNTRQKEILHKKIDSWCKKLATRYLNGNDTLFAHSAYLEPALRYVLSTTSLSYKECNNMMQKIESILINAMHIQRNCPRAVLYAPYKFGGMNKRHIYHLQGIEKLRFFLMHYRRNDDTGKLLKICMAWTQMELGISKPFYKTAYKESVNYLTPTWLTHLWEYLDLCDVQLKICDEECYSGCRENDFYLMDEIRKYPITDKQKYIFNQIRLWLKVETASDLVVSGSKYTICPEIFHGKNNRGSKKEWVNIRDIPRSWFKTWKKILKQYIIPHLRQQPLGRQIKESHQQWNIRSNVDWSIIKIGNVYYERNNDRIFYPTQIQQNNDTFENGVDVVKYKNGYKVIGKHQIRSFCQREEPKHTRWKYRNWGTAQLDTQAMEKIKIALQNDNLAVASDGSVLAGKGAHAFCLVEDDTYAILLQGAGPVDGNANYITSYRSESFGALAAITMIEFISEKYEIEKKTIRMYIDNTETINTIKQRKHLNSTSMVISDHIDIAIELASTVKNSSHIYIPEHVKSHDSGEITRAQELNEQMDALVGTFIRQPPPRLYPSNNAVYLPSQQIGIVHRNEIVEVDIENVLAQNLFNTKIMYHFKERHNITPETMQQIDFLTVEQVLSSNKKELPQRIKNINSEWNTAHVNKKWGKTKTARCPLCHQCDENWKHVFNCQEKDMQRKKNEHIQTIDKMLTKLKTITELKNHLLNVFRNWNRAPIELDETDANSPYFQGIAEAHRAQKKIGYAAFMSGFLTYKWGDIQEQYYRIEIRDSKYNITRWRQNVLRLVYNHGHAMWTERCKIISAENMATEEQRYRIYLQEFQSDVAKRKDQILHRFDHHLVQRKPNFFQQSDRTSLEMWHIRIQNAIQWEEEEKKKRTNTMEKYVKRTKRAKRPRKRRLQKDRIPQYTQKTLWQQVQRVKSPQGPSVDVPNEEAQRTKKRRVANKRVKNNKRDQDTMQQMSLTLSDESSRAKRGKFPKGPSVEPNSEAVQKTVRSRIMRRLAQKRKRKHSLSQTTLTVPGETRPVKHQKNARETMNNPRSTMSINDAKQSTNSVRRNNKMQKREDIRTYLRRTSSDPKNDR